MNPVEIQIRKYLCVYMNTHTRPKSSAIVYETRFFFLEIFLRLTQSKTTLKYFNYSKKKNNLENKLCT